MAHASVTSHASYFPDPLSQTSENRNSTHQDSTPSRLKTCGTVLSVDLGWLSRVPFFTVRQKRPHEVQLKSHHSARVSSKEALPIPSKLTQDFPSDVRLNFSFRVPLSRSSARGRTPNFASFVHRPPSSSFLVRNMCGPVTRRLGVRD